MQILNPSRWYLHPVFIFACSIIALATFLVLTVGLYMEIRGALEVIILKFSIDPQSIFPSKTGMTILVLSLLITVVMAGILLAFIYYQKTVNLFRLQHNFIYNFTHELKTPVTSLRIYLETFVRHPLEPEDVKKYSTSMLKDIDRLTENIDRILNLARIESQNFGSEITRESMVVLVENFCEKNASIFRDLDIRIKNPSGARFEYPVNLFLFEILLMNLISNAIKYNESDQPRLTIVFKSFLQKITIDFIDNGIGVDRQEAKKIFRKFYQAGPGNAGGATGSGLGLYLVESISMIHGWRASVSSAGKGQGSKFTITIPRASIASVREKEIMETTEKKRILVIEDEAHIADGIRLNLTLQGYEVAVAPDGIEGLDKWRSWTPDLIVLDVMLPMIDGFSILKTIRREDEKIPVLILSARGDTKDKVKGLQYGVDDYLSKPFDLDEFLLRVARLLKKKEWYEPAREEGQKASHTLFEGDAYSFGKNSIDFVTFKADCAAGEIILTEQEATLLKIFIAHKGRPLSREMLLNAGWGYARDTSTRTVDNFIVRFRKYFEDKPKKPVYFKSRRSVGYIFDHD